MATGSPFVLRVPIDVSRVPDFTPGRRISVLAWNGRGYREHRKVAFEKKGAVTVTFKLERAPESLQITLGPEDATPFELRHLQTVSIAVPPSVWQASRKVELPAIRLTAWDWWWWQHWRHNFSVTGRVVNAQGRPVAGAAVTAFDVDAWWWWSAKELAGSAITESDGSFAIEFTRSCGWSPSWWWTGRRWQVDALLMERILLFLRQYPELGTMSVAVNSAPSLEIVQHLLTRSAGSPPSTDDLPPSWSRQSIDPAALDHIRERLVEILPRQFSLPIWPWSAWSPWEDCGANLIFRVTDMQRDRTAVLLNEGVVDARWEIPSALDVRLTACRVPCYLSRPEWTLVDYLFPIPRSPFPGQPSCPLSAAR